MSILQQILNEQKRQTQLLSDIRVILSDSNNIQAETLNDTETIIEILSPPTLELRLGQRVPQ